MPRYSELQSKFSRDMGSLSGKSPLKPDIMAQVEEEPANLRRFIFNLEALFSEELIEDAQFNVADWFYNKQHKIIGVQFKTWLYGEHLKTQVIYFPKNWFEHLKERVLPNFLRVYWPVKLRTVEVDLHFLYPQLRKKLTMPEEAHVIHGVVDYGEDDEEE